MFLIFFWVGRLVRGFSGWLGGGAASIVPRCGFERVKGHGNYELGLKRYFCKACGWTFNE